MSSPRRSRRPSAAKPLPEASRTPLPIHPLGEAYASVLYDVAVDNVGDIAEVEDDAPIASVAGKDFSMFSCSLFYLYLLHSMSLGSCAYVHFSTTVSIVYNMLVCFGIASYQFRCLRFLLP